MLHHTQGETIIVKLSSWNNRLVSNFDPGPAIGSGIVVEMLRMTVLQSESAMKDF